MQEENSLLNELGKLFFSKTSKKCFQTYSIVGLSVNIMTTIRTSLCWKILKRFQLQCERHTISEDKVISMCRKMNANCKTSIKFSFQFQKILSAYNDWKRSKNLYKTRIGVSLWIKLYFFLSVLMLSVHVLLSHLHILCIWFVFFIGFEYIFVIFQELSKNKKK